MAESRKTSKRQRRDSKEDIVNFRLVLVGRTGVGKSSTGNTILGRDAFKSAGGHSSETSECRKDEEWVCERTVSVVDTPGLFDTSQNPDMVKGEISKCINLSAPGPHAFLLVIQLGPFSTEERDAVMQVQEIFGADIWKFTIIIFTHGDSFEGDFDKQLKENATPELKEILQKVEHRYQVFNNLRANNRGQVLGLIEKVDKMVSDNGKNHYTNFTYLQVKKMLDQTELKLKEFYEKKLEEEIKTLKSVKERVELQRFYDVLLKHIRPIVEQTMTTDKDDVMDEISQKLSEKLSLSFENLC